MTQPGRDFSNEKYRFGFNGKENDGEVKGSGNQQDYGMRIYDPRLGKFLSVDPLTGSYPMLTPYQFSSNSPVTCIDLDGQEGVPNTGFGSDPMSTFAYHMSAYMRAASSSFDKLSAKIDASITSWFAKDEKKYKTSSLGVNVSGTVKVTANPSQLFDPNNYTNNTYTGKDAAELEVEVDVNIKRKTEISVKTPAVSVSNTTTVTTTVASTDESNVGKTKVSNDANVSSKLNGIPVVAKRNDEITIGKNGKTESASSSTDVGIGTNNLNATLGTSNAWAKSSYNAKANAEGSVGPIDGSISIEISKKK